MQLVQKTVLRFRKDPPAAHVRVHALGVEYKSTLGRGSQARAIQEALRTHFARKGGPGHVELSEPLNDPKGHPPASARATGR